MWCSPQYLCFPVSIAIRGDLGCEQLCVATVCLIYRLCLLTVASYCQACVCMYIYVCVFVNVLVIVGGSGCRSG